MPTVVPCRYETLGSIAFALELLQSPPAHPGGSSHASNGRGGRSGNGNGNGTAARPHQTAGRPPHIRLLENMCIPVRGFITEELKRPDAPPMSPDGLPQTSAAVPCSLAGRWRAGAPQHALTNVRGSGEHLRCRAKPHARHSTRVPRSARRAHTYTCAPRHVHGMLA